ncbi:hypothetical protein ACX3VT_05380 [Aerococcus sanguinicola]|uniref:hypothetical protein n=1 Tax=unclassified Aerococcus TaxID=2618060 RepID=UPI00143AC23B|nr:MULTISPECIES: hypothetical protein [unclassified Aerococcus]MDK6234318.1 hypothetical protein [Aerococcus sp. UMB10185]MDK6856422.1 hypothetical protein [Aerococcus sp. UMB7533]
MSREILRSLLLTIVHGLFIFLALALIEKIFSLTIPFALQFLILLLYVLGLNLKKIRKL